MVLAQLRQEVGPCIRPVGVGGSGRNAKELGGFWNGETPKIAELNELCDHGFLGSEPVQRLVERQDVDSKLGRCHEVRMQLFLGPIAAMLQAILAPSVLDQDPSHGLRRRGEEMAAPTPLRRWLVLYQAQIRLMDECCGLQRLAWVFSRQTLSRQAAQLVVHQRKKLTGSRRIPFAGGIQVTSDVAHQSDPLKATRCSPQTVGCSDSGRGVLTGDP